MKRLIGSLAVVFLLAACGSSNDSSVSTSVDQEQAQDNPEAQTLAGVDQNDNGVRDDMEQAVRDLGETEDRTAASLQVAGAVQSAILAGGPDAEEGDTREAGEELAAAVDCLTWVFGEEGSSRLNFIEFMAQNSTARSKAYNDFNQNTATQAYGDLQSQEVACD